MLQDKIQKFQEETLRENTLKTQAKMLSILNWHKSDEMMCLWYKPSHQSLQKVPNLHLQSNLSKVTHGFDKNQRRRNQKWIKRLEMEDAMEKGLQ